jgi:hypothetical protein
LGLKSLQLLIKEGNAQAVIKDLVFAAHFDKLSSSLGTNKAAAELGKSNSTGCLIVFYS